MALEATHIRFALDIQDLLGVSDMDAYVSGSIYPDSRYVTGIDRLATHPKDYRDDHMFKSTDFRKGWFAHLLADDIQGAIMHQKLPQTSEGTGEESWIKRSAIKILQDIDDAKQFDLPRYLSCLAYVENPNGEDMEGVRRYNSIFPAMYAEIPSLTISKAEEMWTAFGVGEEIARKMALQSEQYAKDRVVMDAVSDMYALMLEKARQDFPH